MTKLTLISSPTCPYVQRAVIALKEKGAPFEVVYVDLQAKPDWFLAMSPLGKVPVLKVEREGRPDAVLFESSVILEYLEETTEGTKLHPADPLEKAQHRAWMEFGSTTLTDLFKYYGAKTAEDMAAGREVLIGKFRRLEGELGAGPFFAGERFSAVDAVFGPLFRQVDVLAEASGDNLLEDFPKVAAWARALAARPSVSAAVPDDYKERYLGRLKVLGSHLMSVAA